METTDWRKVIASDDREFNYGEIYLIKDDLINFPESLFVGRTFHEVRPVVVTYHSVTNQNKRIWTINVAPISTQVDFRRDTDLLIDPAEGNYINRTSLIRLGLSQPVLKVDLEGPVGSLTRSQKLQLAALQMKLAGIVIPSGIVS
jgi:hypothetical protein